MSAVQSWLKLGKISHVLPRTNSRTKKPYKKGQKITQEGWHVLVKDYLLGKSVNIHTYPETTERHKSFEDGILRER